MDNLQLLNELMGLVNDKPRSSMQYMKFYDQIKLLTERHKKVRFRIASDGTIKEQKFVPDDWIRIEEKNGVTSVVIQSKLNQER